MTPTVQVADFQRRIFRRLGLAASVMLLASFLTGLEARAQTHAVGDFAWDLPLVYPNQEAWDRDRTLVLNGITAIDEASGRRIGNAASLADVLDLLRGVRGRAGKMARFAILSTEIDQSSSLARSRYDAATALETQVAVSASPLEAQIAAIGQQRIVVWQRRERRLDMHRSRLHRILAQAPYRPQQMQAIAAMDRWPRSLADTASALASSDLGWTRIGVAGEQEAVDGAVFARLRRSSDRSVRDAANRAYFARLRAFEQTFGSLLARRIDADITIAQMRGLENHIDAFYLLRDGIPPGAYRRAIAVSQSSADSMRRLAGVMRRLYGVERVTYGDLQGRPYAYSPALPIGAALENALGSVALLGPEYQDVMRRRLAEPWYHIAPMPEKSETLGVWWQVGGGHPYAIMTYRDDLTSSRTFAQIAGGVMMYADIPADRFPDVREEDPPIHGNANWYASGYLHDDYLLQHTSAPNDRIALLVQHLQFLVRLAVQEATLLELEDHMALEARAGRPLSGTQISAYYIAALRRHFGHGQGGFEVEDAFSAMWISDIQDIFLAPYPAVFHSAAAAGALITERLQAGDRDAIASMRNLMARTESGFSHDLLLAQGVDMASDTPYQALFRRIDRFTDLLDAEASNAAPGR